jgi:hypothetical protein
VICNDGKLVSIEVRSKILHSDDQLDALSRAKCFSIFDATSGYWQIPIQEKDRPKTGFTTREGFFQFTVVPFGLKNALALFQCTINNIFKRLL